ncbi:hypothetical protein G6F35_016357 [Rhizopus arrhizus]|nr:hypothetical protein G6F35_016357 [Rhizopus arrhizus]
MSSPALPWNGTLLLDAHVALLQGHAGGSAAHAHYAHQLLLSDGAAWQVAVDGVRQQGQRLWLPSFQSHAILSAPQDDPTVSARPAGQRGGTAGLAATTEPSAAAGSTRAGGTGPYHPLPAWPGAGRRYRRSGASVDQPAASALPVRPVGDPARLA